MTGPLDWSRYRLAQIWEMLRNEPTAIGDRQAVAWDNTARLCEDQADQLDRAAAQLAESWVPTAGSAAEAFQAVIQVLTSAMRRSVQAAHANGSTISDITAQMASTRARIAHLVAQSHEYSDAERGGVPQYSLPGRVPPPARPAGPDAPPLDWRATLDEHARQLMAHMETSVVLRSQQVEIEPRLDLQFGSGGMAPVGGTGPVSVGAAGPTAGAPVGWGTVDSSEPFIAAPIMPTAPSPPTGDVESKDPPSLVGIDPVLESAIPPSMAAPTSDVAGGVDRANIVQTPIGPALRPGGVIGGPAADRPTRSVPGSNRSTSSALAQPIASMPMTPGASPPGSRTGHVSPAGRVASPLSRRRKTSPNNPWAVEQGGPAVLEPPPEPLEHDPGPGVIGIDR